MFEPILNRIATPILRIKSIGTKYESSEIINTTIQRRTATATYNAISLLNNSFVSSTIALIPPTLDSLLTKVLISSTAARVISSLVELLNVTNINLELPFVTLLVISFGKNSSGIVVPVISLILTTLLTPSTSLTLSSNLIMSLSFMFSATITAYAPILKSFVNTFSPCIVSISSGKYTNMS